MKLTVICAASPSRGGGFRSAKSLAGNEKPTADLKRTASRAGSAPSPTGAGAEAAISMSLTAWKKSKR